MGDVLRKLVMGLVAGIALCAAGAATAEEPSNFKILKLEGNHVRWQKTAGMMKAPVVTYALVAANTDFPGARNCRKMTSLDGLIQSSKVATSELREEITAAFAMWESVAGITFRESTDPTRADIYIGAQLEPEGWAFADVFYDTQSPERVKPISRSLICLNPVKRWKIGFDGDLKTYDLRYTLAHEIGHAIGLDHPSGAGSIMGYRYEERFRELQTGDVQGAIALYGPSSPTASAEAKAATDVAPSTPRPASESLGTRALNARSK